VMAGILVGLVLVSAAAGLVSYRVFRERR